MIDSPELALSTIDLLSEARASNFNGPVVMTVQQKIIFSTDPQDIAASRAEPAASAGAGGPPPPGFTSIFNGRFEGPGGFGILNLLACIIPERLARLIAQETCTRAAAAIQTALVETAGCTSSFCVGVLQDVKKVSLCKWEAECTITCRVEGCGGGGSPDDF